MTSGFIPKRFEKSVLASSTWQQILGLHLRLVLGQCRSFQTPKFVPSPCQNSVFQTVLVWANEYEHESIQPIVKNGKFVSIKQNMEIVRHVPA